MTNPTPHGQVPEALIDLIDAYAETRHRCGGIYNARTESARNAVIEALSGVQALSAAPADIAKLRHLYANLKNGGVRDAAQAKRIADGLLAPIIERLELYQAAPKAAPGESLTRDQIREVFMAHGFTVKEGQTDLKQYVYDAAYALLAMGSAPQQEAQEPVWDGKLSDAMRKSLNALYLECGQGIAQDIAHQVRKECEAIYTSYTTAKRMYQAARDRLEVMEAKQPQPDPFAAPQPEAQKPVAWLNPWRADQVTTDYDAYGERGIPLYTAPQPAPQPSHVAQAAVPADLITLRKPTTSAELLWLLKLAHLVISDVDKTLEETFAPAQPAAEASRFGSPELQAMIIARCVEKDQADNKKKGPL